MGLAQFWIVEGVYDILEDSLHIQLLYEDQVVVAGVLFAFVRSEDGLDCRLIFGTYSLSLNLNLNLGPNVRHF